MRILATLQLYDCSTRCDCVWPMVAPDSFRTSDVFVASLAAEITQRVLLHPVDTLKARLQYMRSETGRHPSRLPLLGDLAALRHPSVNLGLFSLYRGLLPTVVGVVPTALVYMPTYELSKAWLSDTHFEPLAGCITGDGMCSKEAARWTTTAGAQLVHLAPMAWHADRAASCCAQRLSRVVFMAGRRR